jgi:hypothetical protein
MVALNKVFLWLLYISFFVSPMCVAYIWLRRAFVFIRGTDTNAGWRWIVLLGAQLMLTAAVVLVCYWLLNHSRLAGPEEDAYLRRFFTPSAALAITALLLSLFGTGTAKRTTVLSSGLVLVNWFAVAVFQ